MNARQDQLFKAIIAHCADLEHLRPDFRRNARERMAALRFMAFDEVLGVCERGCRASFGSIFGRPATDAERMQLHRDLPVLEREGIATLSRGEGRQRYVQPALLNKTQANPHTTPHGDTASE